MHLHREERKEINSSKATSKEKSGDYMGCITISGLITILKKRIKRKTFQMGPNTVYNKGIVGLYKP
jgi:hypothetical protein